MNPTNGSEHIPTQFDLEVQAWERKMNTLQHDTNFISNLINNAYRGGYRMGVSEAKLVLNDVKRWVEVQKEDIGPRPSEEENLIIPVGGIIS